MSNEDFFRIDRIQGIGDPTQAPKAKGDGAKFRELLEQIEALGKQGPEGSQAAGEVADTEELGKALEKADEDFVRAMELRRALEEAYRRSQE